MKDFHEIKQSLTLEKIAIWFSNL